jgi:putative transposase
MHQELSVRQQCALLHLARSNLYYKPVEADAEELALMRHIDRLCLEHPYYGNRRMEVVLRQQGLLINCKRVQRLMRLMGLEGMAPGPHTSRPRFEHPRFPYLLRHLAIVRPDQVWASDITFGGDHGLVQPGGAGLSAVQHAERGALPRRSIWRTLTTSLG